MEQSTESLDDIARVIVISGASGSGKSTIVQAMIKKFQSLSYAISYTTRSPRPEEKDGREYHFVDKEEFGRLIDSGEILEWEKICEEFYGTGKKSLIPGKTYITELDVKGAVSIKEWGKKNTLTLFLFQPTEVLEDRLRKRGTENEGKMSERLHRSIQETRWALGALGNGIDQIVGQENVESTVESLISNFLYGKSKET